jgi:K+-sensing histidine kinase KdpD
LHSIVKDYRRSSNVELKSGISQKRTISIGVDYIEYIISSLIDNAWKHSNPNTTVEIGETEKGGNLIDLTFSNFSPPLRRDIDIFQVGAKNDPSSKGFGYGLFWVKILVEYYNSIFNAGEVRPDRLMQIEHSEDVVAPNMAIQSFKLSNIKVD